MSAYWIAEYVEVTDEDKMAAYRALATSAIESAGGTFLARGLPPAPTRPVGRPGSW